MKVKNINGTSEQICKCGSWIEHWKRFSGRALPTLCPEVLCMERDMVGAHVQRDVPGDNSWYIVPLCAKHNAMKGEALTVSDHIKLVSANVAATCGK